jgi:programmed cell death 6-interacting protein
LTFTYTAAFQQSAAASTHSSLAFEHAAVLFNIAASLCQLAEKQDTMTCTCLYYQVMSHFKLIVTVGSDSSYMQRAAGYISYLSGSKFLQVLCSISRGEVVLEFSERFLGGLHRLMIAQAQKWAWRKAISSRFFHFPSHPAEIA